MRTFVYVDGLNLYYGSTKDTSHRWLDLRALSEKVLSPNNKIIKIKLFTATVKPTKTDQTVHLRQQAYLRALESFIPEIEIHYGHFLEHEVSMVKAPAGAKPKFVKVIKREEKGSDVNLALHFLNDAWLDKYDCGVIISNDSDLAEAIKLVRLQTKKIIGVVSPFKAVSKELAKHSHFQRKIRASALAASQMPSNIPGTNITKPKSW